MTSDVVLKGIKKAMMMREALASCQLEGIGLDLTLKDLYLAELGIKKEKLKWLPQEIRG